MTHNRTKHNYYIITYGCTFNFGDSLKIQNILSKYNFNISNIENAELIIVNTCAVKNATHTKIIDYLKKIRGLYPEKKIIVTGCLPYIQLKVKKQISEIIGKFGRVIHPHNIINIIEYIQDDPEKIIEISSTINIRDKSYLFPFCNENKSVLTSVPVQISEGCNNMCTYCCTTNARGSLFSFSNEQIISQIKKMITLGVKEFHLTSQDLGNYQFNRLKLHDLLKDISSIEGNVRFRLGMLNPDYLIKNIDDFLTIFDDLRFYRFLHIPIQSANNNVLEKMRRKYKIEDVEKIISKIINFDQHFSMATDIITGFPTETNEEHNETIRFIEKWEPNVLNISKYSARPNTLAKKMPQLSSQIIKKRSKEFTSINHSFGPQKLKKWIGWQGKVFFNEYHKNKIYTYTGRNNYYIPILCNNVEIGLSYEIEIIDILNQSLIGKKVEKMNL